MLLHEQILDPLWKNEPDRKAARRWVYKFLAKALGIERDQCHTGMFTIERCRDAWRALSRARNPTRSAAWNDRAP